MKASLRQEPEEMFVHGLVHVFDSEKTQGLKHVVYVGNVEGFCCSCIGFNMHGNCWHIDKVKEVLLDGES